MKVVDTLPEQAGCRSRNNPTAEILHLTQPIDNNFETRKITGVPNHRKPVYPLAKLAQTAIPEVCAHLYVESLSL